PWNMPELGHNQIRVLILQHPRQKPEMIILNEHECGVIAGFLDHGIGEYLIGLTVTFPVAALKYGTMESNVAQWPKGLIGEAVIIFLLEAFIDPDAPESVGGRFGRHADPVPGIDHRPIRVSSP